MGAGILPVAFHNNDIYFLFGKERDRPNETARGWADFGGGAEKNEKTIDIAAREGSEELSGFLGDKTNIRTLLKKKKLVLRTENLQYTTYIVPIAFDKNLPKYFNNQIKFINGYIDDHTLNNTTMYEKEELKWFNYKALIRNKNKFRKFYQEMVTIILNNKSNINNIVKAYRKSTRKQRKNRTNTRIKRNKTLKM